VGDGVIFTTKTRGAGSPNIAQAFDVSTGALLWTVSVPRLSMPKVVAAGLVYYGSDGGPLDAPTGAPRSQLRGEYLVADGPRLITSVSAADGSSTLIAVDTTGTKQWSLTAAGSISCAVVQGGRLVVASFINLGSPPGGILLLSTYDQHTGSLLSRLRARRE
jgi:outer membrane protein assembly factor BamB